jgi:uncharacterized protein (TIGR02231 family)
MAKLSLVAPVVEVTLLEDRAHVIRRGRVTLPAGSSTIVVEGVAPILSDRTLAAVVLHNAAPRINDVRVKRQRIVLQKDLPAEIQKLKAELEELDRDMQRHAAQRELLGKQITFVAGAASQALKEFSEDTSWGKAFPEEWRAQLETLSAHERALRDRALDLAVAMRDASVKKANLESRIASLHHPSTRQAASIEADIFAAEPAEVEVQIEYIVPGACWRPQHTARLLQNADGTQRVQFTSDGCVWQNTGEDWTDVALLFSTQRPSLGTEPPKLSTETLAVQKKQAGIAVESREQEIVQAGMGAGKRTAAPEVPGIDDGGEALKLRAAHKATIPSDGRPWRVALFSFETPASTEWMLVPELAPSAVLKGTQTNTSNFPLLAGPVDLLRDSGYVGRTSILFIAPGEQFGLSWGPDSEVRVHREHEKLEEDKPLISNWLAREHRIASRLSNLGAVEKRIKITERVPISEVEKVEIAFDAKNTTEQKTPDVNGFVNWSVTLAPFGHAAVNMRYTVKRHKDVMGI